MRASASGALGARLKRASVPDVKALGLFNEVMHG